MLVGSSWSKMNIVFVCWKLFSKNMLVRYRGKNNKGVLERPGTKWKVLRAISSTLKCQFTGKCWKVDFPMPCKTKSCQSSTECLRMLRALPPDTPRPPQFQPYFRPILFFVGRSRGLPENPWGGKSMGWEILGKSMDKSRIFGNSDFDKKSRFENKLVGLFFGFLSFVDEVPIQWH